MFDDTIHDMKIRREDISYADIASRGLEGIIKDVCPNDAVGLARHKGFRRSVAGASVLTAMMVPVANKKGVTPTINYTDFLGRNFTVDNVGLSVPAKTDFPFQALILFNDDSPEERAGVKRILQLLDVEALGVINIILVAHVQDEGGLLGLE